MKVLEQKLDSFRLARIFNFHCWLATVPAPELDEYGVRTPESDRSLGLADLSMAMEAIRLRMECVDCSSPKMIELSELLASPEVADDVTEFAQNVVNFILGLLAGETSFVQTNIDRMIVDAPRFCPYHPEYDYYAKSTEYKPLLAEEYSTDSSVSFLIAILTAMACVAVGFALIYFAVRCIVARRHRRWIATVPREQLFVIYEKQRREEDFEAATNLVSKSMFLSPQIPLWVRLLVPVVLLGNIALFLSGHLSQGGVIRVFIQIGGQEIMLDNLYSFSVFQAGLELWKAGSTAIAVSWKELKVRCEIDRSLTRCTPSTDSSAPIQRRLAVHQTAYNARPLVLTTWKAVSSYVTRIYFDMA
jgi:hypothetical protein